MDQSKEEGTVSKPKGNTNVDDVFSRVFKPVLLSLGISKLTHVLHHPESVLAAYHSCTRADLSYLLHRALRDSDIRNAVAKSIRTFLNLGDGGDYQSANLLATYKKMLNLAPAILEFCGASNGNDFEDEIIFMKFLNIHCPKSFEFDDRERYDNMFFKSGLECLLRVTNSSSTMPRIHAASLCEKVLRAMLNLELAPLRESPNSHEIILNACDLVLTLVGSLTDALSTVTAWLQTIVGIPYCIFEELERNEMNEMSEEEMSLNKKSDRMPVLTEMWPNQVRCIKRFVTCMQEHYKQNDKKYKFSFIEKVTVSIHHAFQTLMEPEMKEQATQAGRIVLDFYLPFLNSAIKRGKSLPITASGRVTQVLAICFKLIYSVVDSWPGTTQTPVVAQTGPLIMREAFYYAITQHQGAHDILLGITAMFTDPAIVRGFAEDPAFFPAARRVINRETSQTHVLALLSGIIWADAEKHALEDEIKQMAVESKTTLQSIASEADLFLNPLQRQYTSATIVYFIARIQPLLEFLSALVWYLPDWVMMTTPEVLDLVARLLYASMYDQWRSWLCLANFASSEVARKALSKRISGEQMNEFIYSASLDDAVPLNRPDLRRRLSYHVLGAVSNLAKSDYYRSAINTCNMWEFIKNGMESVAVEVDVKNEDFLCRALMAIINLSCKQMGGKQEAHDHEVNDVLVKVLDLWGPLSRRVCELSLWAVFNLCADLPSNQEHFSGYAAVKAIVLGCKPWLDDERVAARLCRVIHVICRGGRKERKKFFLSPKWELVASIRRCAAANALKEGTLKVLA